MNQSEMNRQADTVGFTNPHSILGMIWLIVKSAWDRRAITIVVGPMEIWCPTCKTKVCEIKAQDGYK